MMSVFDAALYTSEQIEKSRIVRNILNGVIEEACAVHDIIAIFNPMNESAFAVLYDGAQPKSHRVTLRTLKNGLLKGYIAGKKSFFTDQGEPSKPVVFLQKGQRFVVDEISEQPVAEHLQLSDPMHSLCDQNGRFITSDLDVLMLIPRPTVGHECCHAPQMGQILRYEYEFSQTLNYLFSQSLIKHAGLPEDHVCDIIKHGPFNRFSGTKRSHIHFPLQVNVPGQQARTIGHEGDRERSLALFFAYIEELKDHGWKPSCHQNWEAIEGV